MGRVTPHGRAMAGLALHPRLAHMVLSGKRLGQGALACDLAALLSERDILRGRQDADLQLRVEALRDAREAEVDRGRVQRVREAARQFRRRLDVAAEDANVDNVGLLLAFAYPDRIALRRGTGGLHYRLSNGRGAFFREPEPLAAHDCLAVAELDGDKRDARIFLAAPLTLAAIEDHFADQIVTSDIVAWESREQIVAARRQRRLGELVLDEARQAEPSPEAISAAMLTGIAEMGLPCLPWTGAAQSLRSRIGFMRRVEGGPWPDLSDDALLATLDRWLGPWLIGMTRRAHLARLDMQAVLEALLSRQQKKALDAAAPTHIAVPSGSRLPIDYGSGAQPDPGGAAAGTVRAGRHAGDCRRPPQGDASPALPGPPPGSGDAGPGQLLGQHV